MRTLFLGGLGLLVAGCQAAPPPPPPAMSDGQKMACIRGVIVTDLQGLSRLTSAGARSLAERAAGRCGYDAGEEQEAAVAEATDFATKLQTALHRRRVASAPGGQSAHRPNAVRSSAREEEVQEASELYAACIRDNAASLARASSESATVVAEAAGGACAVDRARLAQLGGPRLQEEMDRMNRPAALNAILRARATAATATARSTQ